MDCRVASPLAVTAMSLSRGHAPPPRHREAVRPWRSMTSCLHGLPRRYAPRNDSLAPSRGRQPRHREAEGRGDPWLHGCMDCRVAALLAMTALHPRNDGLTRRPPAGMQRRRKCCGPSIRMIGLTRRSSSACRSRGLWGGLLPQGVGVPRARRRRAACRG